MASPLSRRGAAQERRRQQEQQAAAAATAAAGASGSVPVPPPLPPVDARATATTAILATLTAFHAQLAKRDETYLGTLLGPRGEPDDVAETMATERDRGVEFERRQRERIQAGLARAMALPDPVQRNAAVQAVLSREQAIVVARQKAMTARATAAVDRAGLRRLSPQGAFWRGGRLVNSCPTCRVMGMRAWPWVVLDRYHPPAHPQCQCDLMSIADALQEGLMQPGQIPSDAEALRMVAGMVIQEAEAITLAETLEEQAAVEELVERGQLTRDAADALLAG